MEQDPTLCKSTKWIKLSLSNAGLSIRYMLRYTTDIGQ